MGGIQRVAVHDMNSLSVRLKLISGVHMPPDHDLCHSIEDTKDRRLVDQMEMGFDQKRLSL